MFRGPPQKHVTLKLWQFQSYHLHLYIRFIFALYSIFRTEYLRGFGVRSLNYLACE